MLFKRREDCCFILNDARCKTYCENSNYYCYVISIGVICDIFKILGISLLNYYFQLVR